MSDFTDIPQGGFKSRLPARLRACIELARLDRPIGIWLLLFPCFWGLALAGGGNRQLYALFAIGAVVMRGAGCTLNDIVDRKIDAQVERTKLRPLPSGRIGIGGAVAFLVLQLLAGLAVLVQLNLATIELGCASLALVAIYPLMKRVTWWPQFVLGLAFNWGILMAWVAVGGKPILPVVLLYGGGIAWTLGYDTIYAHQDRRDDKAAGVKSTALRFGASVKKPIVMFYALFFGATALAGSLVDLMWIFYVMLAGIAAFAAIVIARWKPDSPSSCLAAFKANRWIGLAVFAAIVAGQRCL
jgi:4-hydroxybenzoate polyprenyltransferase